MEREHIDYNILLHKAMLGIVKDVLKDVSEHGLPGEHHFYVGFLTQHPRVKVPDFLKEQYPKEMTIVLQHKYWNLQVNPEGFNIDLSFNDTMHTLHIPFDAIISFVDPEGKFGFQPMIDKEEESELLENEMPEKPPHGGGSKVISLDKFRKKDS